MMFEHPKITGNTPMEQIVQIRGYLYRLAEQLNLQLGNADGAGQQQSSAGTAGTAKSNDNSNDILTAVLAQIRNVRGKTETVAEDLYSKVQGQMDGEYVALEDFATYEKQVTQEILGNAAQITKAMSALDEVDRMLQEICAARAHIRQGLLFTAGQDVLDQELGQAPEDGTGIYGVELGQTTVADGQEAFDKFARFTDYGTTLYDNSGRLVAYITDGRCYVPDAVIKKSITRGGFVETIYPNGSSVERWVGL